MVYPYCLFVCVVVLFSPTNKDSKSLFTHGSFSKIIQDKECTKNFGNALWNGSYLMLYGAISLKRK